MSSTTGALTPSKIVCVGRNYAEHAAELNNPLPAEPLLFIKPSTAVTRLPQVLIPLHQGACHHELELTLLIGTPLRRATTDQALAAVAGVGLGLDLTLRDVQSRLKAAGQPWERAKAFDGSCALGPFINATEVDVAQPFGLQLFKNSQLVQQGNTADLLFPLAQLLADISQQFTLLPGDVVMTGTPAGVGPLNAGDQLLLCLTQGTTRWQWPADVAFDS
ncbi:MAG: Ureidoglycolate lyase [Pseudidiomarina mangrovi]|nr:MAG: Ureidoglycolate lyase [Pseudidiomarina mangrovi]